ncbi:MAG: DUF4294 domain-containing protein [Bacteroides sp.]|nr:DUF4294 domain-containing protein [Bacteroides sp.]
MNRLIHIATTILALCTALAATAQEKAERQQAVRVKQGTETLHLTPMCIYQGDTIPSVQLPTVYVFKPLRFKNKRQQRRYTKLVRDVKKTLPIAKEIRGIIIQTYKELQRIPTEKGRKQYLKETEKRLKEEYTPRMKKLTFSQGKLLIKLVDRETDSTGYELVKAFMGSFKAGFYQTFAALFGASLKKEYDAEGDDILTERVILLVESGAI